MDCGKKKLGVCSLVTNCFFFGADGVTLFFNYPNVFISEMSNGNISPTSTTTPRAATNRTFSFTSENVQKTGTIPVIINLLIYEYLVDNRNVAHNNMYVNYFTVDSIDDIIYSLLTSLTSFRLLDIFSHIHISHLT